MVFLTSLDILDTGFLTVLNRTNQLATTDRVNSGSALRLKGVEFDITSSANLDKATTPGYYPTSLNNIQRSIKTHEIRSLVSINPITISLKIILNSNNDDTTNLWGINDMALLSELLNLTMTAGWKAIYYPVDNTATDTGSNTTLKRNNQMVYQLGETDTTEDQGDIDITLWTGNTSASSKNLTDVNYIPVRFDSFNINQLPQNKIEVTLGGVITG